VTEEIQATASTPKRAAIVLELDIQEKVATIAKTYKLSQGQVIQTMIDMVGTTPEFDAALKAKRTEKVSNRTGKTAILKRLSKLSAEELEALAKSLKSE
jgi:hypothetical protein